MVRWRYASVLASVLVVVVACSAGPGGTPAASASAAASQPGASAAPSDSADVAPSASGPGLPAACDLLTTNEVSAALGKTVGEGTALGKFICEWSTDPQSFSNDASLLAQSMADEYCEPALVGGPVSGFGRAGAWDYSDSFDVPQGTLSACVTGGLVSVTLTGHVNDPSDEPGYRSRAETLLNLVLGRL